MKTTILFFLLLSLGAVAQVPDRVGSLSDRNPDFLSTYVVTDTVFYNVYGGPNQEEAEDFVETADKGFFICGSSSSYGQGASSFYLVKTDSMGRFKWGKTFGWINSDRGMSIRLTPDKRGAYISGYSNSFNNLDYDAYCVRIDSAGNFLWQRSFDGGDWDFVYGSDVMADSGLVMVGETYSNTAGDADAWVIRMDKNGDTLWTRKFGTPYQERFNKVLLYNNEIYAAGKIFDPLTQHSKGFVAHYSVSGTLLDTLTLPADGPWDYEVKGINENGVELLIAGGIVDPNAATGLQQSEFRAGVGFQLSLHWLDHPGFGDVKVSNYLMEDNRGHLIAVMTQTGGNGKTAMFLADFYGGAYQQGFTYGGLEVDEGIKGMITSRNKLAFLGNTYSWGYGDEDYWLVLFKTDTLIPDHKIRFYYHNDTIALSPISLEELSTTGATLFPNPVSKNGLITLRQASAPMYNTLEILDIQGRKVADLTIEGEEKITIRPDMFGMEAGMYFVRLTGGQSTRTLKIAIQD